MDNTHNTLVAMIESLNTEYKELSARLRPATVKGTIMTGVMSGDELLVLRPLMVSLNELVESMRIMTRNNSAKSGEALSDLHSAFKDKFGLHYDLVDRKENKVNF